MARQIKGWTFQEQNKDAWEEYKAVRFYLNTYKEEDVKILHMKNQFGQPYTNIYTRKHAKPIRKMTASFGSHMRFEDVKKK